jgi:hypothetical protein
MLCNLICKIKKSVINLYNRVFNKNKASNDYTDINNLYCDDNNDNDWYIYTDKKFKYDPNTDEALSRNNKRVRKENRLRFTEMLEAINNSPIKQVNKRNKITLTFTSDIDQISVLEKIQLMDNDKIRYYQQDDKIGAVTLAKLFRYKIEVTCSHVLNLMSASDQLNFCNVNPSIVVKGSNIVNKEIIWRVKSKDEIMWWTRDIDNNKDVCITLQVYQPIMALVAKNKRMHLCAIGIITSFIPDTRYVYSGTLMSVDKKPYIVTAIRIQKTNGVIQVVAIAPLFHDYEIEIVDE